MMYLVVFGILCLLALDGFFYWIERFFFRYYSRKCGYDCDRCRAWSCPAKTCAVKRRARSLPQRSEGSPEPLRQSQDEVS